MRWYFVSSPLTLVVKLHKLTAQKKLQKDVGLFVGKFSVSPLIKVS